MYLSKYKKGDCMKMFMNTKKFLAISALSTLIALAFSSQCFAKTIQKPLTPKQLHGLENDSYMPIPTQQWQFVNKTNQPMVVSVTTESVPENKWVQGYTSSRMIKTPIIKPNEQYTLEYKHMSSKLAQVMLNFEGEGSLTPYNVGDMVGIETVNSLPEGIFIIKDIGLSIPGVELK